MKRIFILLCSLWMLSSCTYNPLSNNNQLTGSAGGAVIGSAVGFGATAALSAPRPLIALATIGGGALGYYLTTLRVAAGPIFYAGGTVYTQGDYLTIVIPTEKIFDSNSAELLPEGTPILNSALAVLERFPCNHILISGNSSGFGPESFEQPLSEARSREVAGYFWSKGISSFQAESIETRKLIYVGYGNYFPIANNIKATGIRQNSRIQITAYPSKSHLTPKNFKLFGNIGGLDSSYLPPREKPRDFSNVFRDDVPPPNSDYKGVVDYKQMK